MAVAAMDGQLATVEWLHSVQRCSWDEDGCRMAATHGHLAVLTYLHDHGCPWGPSTMCGAAQHGYLDIVKYLNVSGCPWDSFAELAAVDPLKRSNICMPADRIRLGIPGHAPSRQSFLGMLISYSIFRPKAGIGRSGSVIMQRRMDA